MYLNKINVIYLHPPKTAGTYIEANLIKYSEDVKSKTYGFQDGKDSFELKGKFTFHKHQNLSDYKKQMPVTTYEKAKILISVRNPLDRIISSYFGADDTKNTKTLGVIKNINRITNKFIGYNLFGKKFYNYKQPEYSENNFIEYIEKIPNQTDYLNIMNQYIEPNFIIKYENLNNDLKNFFKLNNLDLDLAENKKINSGRYKFDTSIIKQNPNVIKKIKESHHFLDYKNFNYKLS